MTKLTQSFYNQPATILAPKLLGKLLCRQVNGEVKKYRITETECYFGENDTACHAHKGKTKRTEILYEQGSYTYIYLCYGIHFLLNVVTGEKNHPEAVLIRGVECYNGPGKLTKALNINKELNKINLTTSNELWIEDDGVEVKYSTSKRIGIDYATDEYRDIEWRFLLEKDK